jgi:hypothetical protein
MLKKVQEERKFPHRGLMKGGHNNPPKTPRPAPPPGFKWTSDKEEVKEQAHP